MEYYRPCIIPDITTKLTEGHDEAVAFNFNMEILK